LKAVAPEDVLSFPAVRVLRSQSEFHYVLGEKGLFAIRAFFFEQESYFIRDEVFLFLEGKETPTAEVS
jgi:hypothetical protein